MKATNKAYYLTAIALQGIALILEILPIGAVMVFATSPTEHTIEICSYFSLLPVRIKKAVARSGPSTVVIASSL